MLLALPCLVDNGMKILIVIQLLPQAKSKISRSKRRRTCDPSNADSNEQWQLRDDTPLAVGRCKQTLARCCSFCNFWNRWMLSMHHHSNIASAQTALHRCSAPLIPMPLQTIIPLHCIAPPASCHQPCLHFPVRARYPALVAYTITTTAQITPNLTSTNIDAVASLPLLLPCHHASTLPSIQAVPIVVLSILSLLLKDTVSQWCWCRAQIWWIRVALEVHSHDDGNVSKPSW